MIHEVNHMQYTNMSALGRVYCLGRLNMMLVNLTVANALISGYIRTTCLNTQYIEYIVLRILW